MSSGTSNLMTHRLLSGERGGSGHDWGASVAYHRCGADAGRAGDDGGAEWDEEERDNEVDSNNESRREGDGVG